jgi:putative tricarboxylic transport membrane protein
MFDVYVMLFFGVVGFLLRRMDYPMAPLVLGIILGDLLDKNLRRGLTLSDGDLTPFFIRPISAFFWILTLATILLSIAPLRRAVVQPLRRLRGATQQAR